ncbi:MAG: galactose mutarotase [Lachnospiraceae bacterium]|nr:galactose mutarotase [Lachnospiraceae bacterium]
MSTTKNSPAINSICDFNNTITITLSCTDGFLVELSSLGAAIHGVFCPVSGGRLQNIALSYYDKKEYLSNGLYAGATLAPAAGRISNGILPIDKAHCPGTNSAKKSGLYHLSRNENNCHTLHGGYHNASFQNWDLTAAQSTENQAQAVFSCHLPDGLDGFPGNRELTAVYTLYPDHRLSVRYEARTDRDTYFNLSNHTYFNLSGDFNRPAHHHLLQIQADHFISNQPDFIPEHTSLTADTPFDFRIPTSVHNQLCDYPDYPQLLRNQGYNHGFILKRSKQISQTASLLTSGVPDLTCTLPDHSLTMRVWSNAPCMVFYSGGYIPSGLLLREKQLSCPGCAYAFEFQDYPDAPGGHGFPYILTAPGETWSREIIYHFS